jgi:hypothetical protein
MRPAARHVYVVSALMLVCTLFATLGRNASSQVPGPVPPTNEVWRYQIVPVAAAPNPYVYFIDTKTGNCWKQSVYGGPWDEVSPLTMRRK